MLDALFIATAAQQARHAQSAAENASKAAGDLRVRTECLARDVEKLFMITEALWTILKEERGYTDETLVKRIQEIDLRDGRLDGRVARQPNPSCPHCNRILMHKHPVCLYCGKPVNRVPFER